MLAELVARKIFDEIYTKARGVLVGEVNAALDTLQNRLDHLDDALTHQTFTLERQVLSHQRAGIAFLTLSDTEAAITEFVRSESIEPLGAVTKLLIAFLLASRGRLAEAEAKVLEANALNPFLLRAFELLKASAVSPRLPGWTRPVLAEDVRQYLPELPYRFIGSSFPVRESSAVVQVAAGGREPVVRWLIGDDLRSTKEGFVSAFDRDTSVHRWSVQAQAKSILFSSARIVALYDRDTRDVIIMDALTGQKLRRCSLEYFGAVLGTFEGSEFDRHHVDSINVTDAYDRPRVPYVGLRDLPRAIVAGTDHRANEFVEEFEVPLRSEPATYVDVTNTWSHYHLLAPAVAFELPITECALWGRATISLRVADAA